MRKSEFKERLNSLGLTTAVFASICGVTLNSVQKWMRNDYIPKYACVILYLKRENLELAQRKFGGNFKKI